MPAILLSLASLGRGRAQAEPFLNGRVGLASESQHHHRPRIVLRAGEVRAAKPGDELDEAQRLAAIEALNAGKHLELEVALLSYRQPKTPGVHPNRNGVRVRAKGFRKMARSAANTPLLRDHRWGELAARGGTVTSVSVEDTDDEQILHENARLVETWAVRAALTGSLDRFSVGMVAVSPVQCTVCNDEVAKCWHWPLETVDGQVVEWEADFHKVETSAVNVPAVEGTGVGAPRLNAHFSTEEVELDDDEKQILELRAKLCAAEARVTELSEQLQAMTTERDTLAAELSAERRDRSEEAADQWLNGLAAEGTLDADSAFAAHLRDLFLSGNEALARQLASELQAGSNRPNSTPQRHRAQTAAPTAERKRWELPIGTDGRVDRAKLVAELDQWPEALRDKVRALSRASSNHLNPVASLHGLFAGGTANRLLEAAGYEPIANWKELFDAGR